MRILRYVCAVMASVLLTSVVDAQNTKGYSFPQSVTPQSVDNYFFAVYYHSGRQVYNIRQALLCKAKGDIVSFKINTSGSSYAVLSDKAGKRQLKIYDLWRTDKILHEMEIQDGQVPSTMCYAPDSKTFVVAYNNETVCCYDTKNHQIKKKIDVPYAVDLMAISSNNYFLATASGSRLYVYNLETHKERFSAELMYSIKSLVFSEDNTMMLITTSNGQVMLYDTSNFNKIMSCNVDGMAIASGFHPGGKYIGVAVNDHAITLINRYDTDDRIDVHVNEGGISDIRFVKDAKEQVFLMYNTRSSIDFYYAGDLKPNYTTLLTDELETRMDDWMKQMDGETMEDYRLRVNEETRLEQINLLEQEIATEMAGNLLEMSEISLGGYNMETNMVAMEFNTMPTIYLDVPEEKVQEFMDVPNLDFRNAKYGLTEDDKFELVYLEVFNKETGSSAIFDNRERRSLDYLKNDAAYIPLEVIQTSHMEEARLESIKEEVVAGAKDENIISDNTVIAVSTKVETSTDADGNKIINYHVAFSYNVATEFSAKEDFAPGRYHVEQSGAAKSMMKIIRKAFETDFAQYAIPGKKVHVKVTGMADNLAITGVIAYDEAYGAFVNEPVYGTQLYALNVDRKSGITTNEQLAFIRAAGVKHQLLQEVSQLADMQAEYQYHIKVNDKVGGEYRRISVEFNFVDAF